jgi:hypothetical protein
VTSRPVILAEIWPLPVSADIGRESLTFPDDFATLREIFALGSGKRPGRELRERAYSPCREDLMAKLVDNPELAFRLARAIVSDIALYNQEKVKEGIKNDNIFDLLQDELGEGREHFYARVSPDLTERDRLFDRAIVDVMIKQAGKIESSIW